jgi:hypothetical protein
MKALQLVTCQQQDFAAGLEQCQGIRVPQQRGTAQLRSKCDSQTAAVHKLFCTHSTQHKCAVVQSCIAQNYKAAEQHSTAGCGSSNPGFWRRSLLDRVDLSSHDQAVTSAVTGMVLHALMCNTCMVVSEAVDELYAMPLVLTLPVPALLPPVLHCCSAGQLGVSPY